MHKRHETNPAVTEKGNVATNLNENDSQWWGDVDKKADMSDNTRRAYYHDIQDYQQMPGSLLPATTDSILNYLCTHTNTVSPRTLQRRLSMLRKWHELRGYPDPTINPVVGKKLIAIARTHGQPKVKAKAIRLPALLQLVTYLDENPSLINSRNKAMLLLGYFGAFRRAELVNLCWEDIEFVPEGVIIKLPRSKTDQTGEGLTCAIPVGPDHYCPVRTLMAWRDASQKYQQYIFCRITKVEKILPGPISAHHWNVILKQLAHAAKLTSADQISSHSLRRGSTTEAASRGAPLTTLKRHGRWRSGASVLEYIEEGRQFKDSAANLLFDF